MLSSTFKIEIHLPKKVRIKLLTGQVHLLDRADFYDWLWKSFQSSGLVGVHEGSILSEDAFKEGLETEAWTIDSGEAPHHRDWIGQQELETAELYFSTEEEARKARVELTALQEFQDLKIGPVTEQKAEDWDAQWKASFQGVLVDPWWKIVPPWELEESGRKNLRINPGAGFGTGTHETTQLCLEAMGSLVEGNSPQSDGFKHHRVLDFGSGSGILAIGAALLGATVDAVEIDALAVENAKENCQLNALDHQVRFYQALPDFTEPYDLVIANILRPVLLEFADLLCQRLSPKGVLILSGLVEGDTDQVIARYRALLPSASFRVLAKNEWRSIVFQGS